MNSVRVGQVAFAVVVCLLYLPFLDKAFHIDDPFFIGAARLLSWNPLAVPPSDWPYMGWIFVDLQLYEATHPLLLPYYIRAVGETLGWSEIALHTSFLIFPAICVASLVALQRRLVPDARAAGPVLAILFLSMPAFLVSSQSIMADVPALAFSLLSIVLFCRAIDRPEASASWSCAGGLLLGVAVFISYQTLIFAPLVLFYGLLRRQAKPHLLVGLALPVVALLVWLLLVYRYHEIFPLLATKLERYDIGSVIGAGLAQPLVLAKGVSMVASIGTSSLFVLALVALTDTADRRFLGRWLLAALVGSAVAVAILREPLAVGSYGTASLALLCLYLALGLCSVALVVQRALFENLSGVGRSERFFLLAWIAGVVAANLLVLPFGASRYALPALPAIVILLIGDRGERISLQRLGPAGIALLLLAAAFGWSTAWSDRQLAGAYRDFAHEIEELRVQGGEPVDVWYIGEWGMHHYSREAGFRYLVRESNEPRKGDLVVIPEVPQFWQPSPKLTRRLALLTTREYRSGLPLRLFNSASHAGFYAHFWGLLPVAISTAPDEHFRVWKVVR